jgi:hypothetical protein
MFKFAVYVIITLVVLVALLRIVGAMRETPVESIVRTYREEMNSPVNWREKSYLGSDYAEPNQTDVCLLEFEGGEFGYIHFANYTKTKAIAETGFLSIKGGELQRTEIIRNIKLSLLGNRIIKMRNHVLIWNVPTVIVLKDDKLLRAAIVPYSSLFTTNTNLFNQAVWVDVNKMDKY